MADKNNPDSSSLPIDSPGRKRLPLLLRKSWYGLNQAFRRRIKHLGATPDQFTALRTLIEAEGAGISQRELAQHMSSDPNTIASLLERMEAGGLIERKEHEKDRRAHRINLLPEGRRRYEALREIAIQLQSEVLGALPPSERDKFLLQLELVAEVCRQAAGNSPGPGAKAAERSDEK